MRLAGIIMTVMGLIALVFAIIGVFAADKGLGAGVGDLIFFKNSWFVIMFIFWFGAGISLLLTFPANEKHQHHHPRR